MSGVKKRQCQCECRTVGLANCEAEGWRPVAGRLLIAFAERLVVDRRLQREDLRRQCATISRYPLRTDRACSLACRIPADAAEPLRRNRLPAQT